MNPLRRKAIELGLVEQLRLHQQVGAKPNMRDIRVALGCTPAELAAAVQALRYAGKLLWDRLELSPSMLAGEEPASGSAGALPAAEGGGVVTNSMPPSGPDDEDGPEDEYPGEVNDSLSCPPHPSQPGAGRRHNAHAHDGAFVPKRLLHKAGTHAAATRAASRPLPVPQHEREVERQVREEVEGIRQRRSLARSTATVCRPLELRKFGLGDLSLGEGVASLLVETPHDLMVAIDRKHAATWRRVILLGRARGERPAEALYAALEAGLEQLEQPAIDQAAA